MRNKEFTYYFILYREHNVLGAISNDIIRRAMGVSIYRRTFVLLIECTDAFGTYVKNYLNNYDVEVCICSLSNAISKIHFSDSDLVVTHTWPTTMYAVVNTLEIRNLALIEEIPPLFDRFDKEFSTCAGLKRGLVDKILTNKLVIRALLIRYRRAVKAANFYVAISEIEELVIKKYYGLHANLTSYNPVDDRFFRYVQNERDSIIVFGSLEDKVGIINYILGSGELGINKIINVNPNVGESDITFPGTTINVLENYNFEDISEYYRRSYLSITSEYRGSFELIPIESIMSGVPVVSPIVPSLSIMWNSVMKSTRTDIYNLPFFDYFRLNEIERNPKLMETFKRWLRSLDAIRKEYADYSSKIFSISVVGKDFIRNVEYNI